MQMFSTLPIRNEMRYAASAPSQRQAHAVAAGHSATA